jgi:hypothetical protein
MGSMISLRKQGLSKGCLTGGDDYGTNLYRYVSEMQ